MDLHVLQADYMLREYKIVQLLGEGGFGLTYLAFDTHLEKHVAIKEYLPSEHAVRTQDSQVAAKSGTAKDVYQWGLNAFLNEAKTLAKFEHPNIVRVYRFFETNGTAYIVMEYCQGGCLTDRVKKNQPMDISILKNIIAPIVQGLRQVHEHGILHRDIKPDNIVFRKDGSPVLIDFGAARQAMGDKSRKLTTIITPGYAPLEQYTSDGVIGPWSDIYSLAAVSYLCLTGQKPADIMNRLNEDTVKSLDTGPESDPFLSAIDSGLALQVDDRPQSLAQWSKKWHDAPSIADKIASTQPIYAKKNVDLNHETINSRPISVRKSHEQNSKTVVNTLDLSAQEKSNWGKRAFILLVIFGVCLFIFDWSFNDKKIYKLIAVQLHALQKNQTQKKTSIELVLKTQQALAHVGYEITQTGIPDQQTIDHIKDFEQNNDWLITGEINEKLLIHLQNHYQKQHDLAWQSAQKKQTQESYKQYINNYPEGQFIQQAQSKLEVLNNQKQNEQKRKEQDENSKRLEEIALAKKQLVSNIQSELIRLKFSQLNANGQIDAMTTDAIMDYQKAKQSKINGLPTKTLLFQLKSEQKWPGKMPGETIQSCDTCPVMVVVPSGQFMMGSETGRDNEKPVHLVNIKEFMISQTEVTFQQWDECYAQGGCEHRPDDEQTGRNQQAVMRVNWYDAQQYLSWINKKTAQKYRLPTESEWEYAARAGSTTAYPWGDDVGVNRANCSGCQVQNMSIMNQVENFAANAFGLYDMHGNVWEWTQDCWHPNYLGAPSDNQAWEPNGCDQFVVRGGSGGNPPEEIRSAARGAMAAGKRLNSLGFRIASD